MEKNKKGTIKEILNKDSIKDNVLDKPKDNEDNNQSGDMDSKASKKQGDISNNINDYSEYATMDENSSTSGNGDSNGASNNSNNYYIDIAILNELSKVCHLAMTNISYLSSRISNKDMKKDLVAIYSQYANILLQIDQNFEKFGEIPENVPNSLKMMGICGIKMNTKFDRSNSKIAEIMIQGENMGVIKAQKLLNGNLDIQKSTIDLLKNFRGFQKENIAKLNVYL